MSDGSSNLKATFWDNFALKINEAVLQATEKPIIIIISSGKIGLWNDEVEISNVSVTRFYLNYKHHSVFQLRRKLAEPNFAEKIMKEQPKKIRELLTLEKITQLGKDYIETEVFTHVNIKNVDDTAIWFINACTTCGRNTELSNGLMVCANCPRTVPHPDKKYKINVAAFDPTGGIDIILCDREIRTLIDKEEQIPTNTKRYCKGLHSGNKNQRVDHNQVYLATNICNGFVKPPQQTFETLNEMSTSQELGIPNVFFWTVNAFTLMCYLHYSRIREFAVQRASTGLKNEHFDHIIDWLPGIGNVRLRDTPSLIWEPVLPDYFVEFCVREISRTHKASAPFQVPQSRRQYQINTIEFMERRLGLY
ncbi:hypothetical protein POM88_043817 [Heracleum sosnowskyi]|uniref:Replication factor A C-terminal domain-containing protein n=1 Tax=Heracleum sosnowskyi TaxID=360622 RepID=A0AAD8M4T8_9APIA|nr:hypothetical protein POM88_043817 [Heracleum sosnowskyi]